MVQCGQCHQTISNKENLIVAVRLILVTTYCASCWGQEQKTIGGVLGVGTPINGEYSNWIFLISIPIALTLLFFWNDLDIEGWVALAGVTVFITYRTYAYIRYEIPLRDKK